MTLPPLHGHHAAREAVARAWFRDRLPQVLLLHGPRGVGKQRFAHWTGQLLVCLAPAESGPCGVCRECSLAERVEHPDIHWYVPLPRPKKRGTPEREAEALEELRVGWIQEARERPFRSTWSEEVTGLHLGTIRNLNRRARNPPSTGPRQLFVIADAEQLVAQESAQEAANALLKTLEEPAPGTHFILTSSEPGRLLPTIRSRASALHLPALPRREVSEFLLTFLDADPEAVDRAARLSGGSVGRALGFLPDGEDDGPLERIRKEAFHLVRSALSPSAGDRFALALGYAPSGARGLSELLGFMEEWLRDLSAASVGAGDQILNQDARKWLMKTAGGNLHPTGPARALNRVEEGRSHASGNVNPQLLLAGLLMDLHWILRSA